MKYYQIDPQVQRIVREATESGDSDVNADTLSRIAYLQQNRDTEFSAPVSADELLILLDLV